MSEVMHRKHKTTQQQKVQLPAAERGAATTRSTQHILTAVCRPFLMFFGYAAALFPGRSNERFIL